MEASRPSHSDESVELVADSAALMERLEKIDLTTTTHQLFSKDAHQQLMVGINTYADAETTVPTPERFGEIPISQDTYRQRRATEALDAMASGGFVLRIFNRT
jgi:hypothetical protein